MVYQNGLDFVRMMYAGKSDTLARSPPRVGHRCVCIRAMLRNASMHSGKCKPVLVIGLQLHYSRVISIPCDEITSILRVSITSVNIKQVARH